MKQNEFQYFHVVYIQSCRKVGKHGKGRDFVSMFGERSGILPKNAKSLEKVGIKDWAGSEIGTVDGKQCQGDTGGQAVTGE